MRLPKGYKLKRDYTQYRKKYQIYKKSRGFVLEGERMLSPRQYERAVESANEGGWESTPSAIAKSQVGVASKRSWEAYNRWYERYTKIKERHGDTMNQVRLTRATFDLKYSQYKELLEEGERVNMSKIIAQDQAYSRSWKQARALKNAIMVAAIQEVEETGMDDSQASDFLAQVREDIPSAMDIMMGKADEYLEENDLLWDAIRNYRERRLKENPNIDRKLLADEVKNNFFYVKQASAI